MLKIVPISYQRLARVLEAEGFRFSRQKGDHLIYTKEDSVRPIVIPMYVDVPVFIIKNILRTAQVSRERYFELLESH